MTISRELIEVSAEVGRMLYGLLRSIRRNDHVRDAASEDLTHDLEILLRQDFDGTVDWR